MDAAGVEPAVLCSGGFTVHWGYQFSYTSNKTIITLSIDYVNLSFRSMEVGECVVKHSPDYVRRRFVAGRENALLRWVFSHTTQGASHPPGRPHYKPCLMCWQDRVPYSTK